MSSIIDEIRKAFFVPNKIVSINKNRSVGYMLSVFSIFDHAAGAYLNPFFMPTRAMAIRAVEAAARDPQNDLSRFAKDYALYELGVFDPVSGKFSAHGEPDLVIRLSDFSTNGAV